MSHRAAKISRVNLIKRHSHLAQSSVGISSSQVDNGDRNGCGLIRLVKHSHILSTYYYFSHIDIFVDLFYVPSLCLLYIFRPYIRSPIQSHFRYQSGQVWARYQEGNFTFYFLLGIAPEDDILGSVSHRANNGMVARFQSSLQNNEEDSDRAKKMYLETLAPGTVRHNYNFSDKIQEL